MNPGLVDRDEARVSARSRLTGAAARTGWGVYSSVPPRAGMRSI